MIISSRPDESFSAHADFTQAELELMTVLLYNVKLGNGFTEWRDAAFTLINKLDDMAFYKYQNMDFAADAVAKINMEIHLLDSRGRAAGILNEDYEIVV